MQISKHVPHATVYQYSIGCPKLDFHLSTFSFSVCPKIDHCNHRRCTSTGDNICVYCDGEVAELKYHRAYTPVPSNNKKCERKWFSSKGFPDGLVYTILDSNLR